MRPERENRFKHWVDRFRWPHPTETREASSPRTPTAPASILTGATTCVAGASGESTNERSLTRHTMTPRDTTACPSTSSRTTLSICGITIRSATSNRCFTSNTCFTSRCTGATTRSTNRICTVISRTTSCSITTTCSRHQPAENQRLDNDHQQQLQQGTEVLRQLVHDSVQWLGDHLRLHHDHQQQQQMDIQRQQDHHAVNHQVQNHQLQNHIQQQRQLQNQIQQRPCFRPILVCAPSVETCSLPTFVRATPC